MLLKVGDKNADWTGPRDPMKRINKAQFEFHKFADAKSSARCIVKKACLRPGALGDEQDIRVELSYNRPKVEMIEGDTSPSGL